MQRTKGAAGGQLSHALSASYSCHALHTLDMLDVPIAPLCMRSLRGNRCTEAEILTLKAAERARSLHDTPMVIAPKLALQLRPQEALLLPKAQPAEAQVRPPQVLLPAISTRSPQPATLNPQPSTLNRHLVRNSEPSACFFGLIA